MEHPKAEITEMVTRSDHDVPQSVLDEAGDAAHAAFAAVIERYYPTDLSPAEPLPVHACEWDVDQRVCPRVADYLVAVFEAPDPEEPRFAQHLCEVHMQERVAMEGSAPVVVRRLPNAAGTASGYIQQAE